jgi:hypothetical protein
MSFGLGLPSFGLHVRGRAASRPQRGRIHKPRAKPRETGPANHLVNPNGVRQRRRDWQSTYRAMDTRCVGSRVFVTPRWGLTTWRIAVCPRAPPWACESCTFGAAGRRPLWAANVGCARVTIVWATFSPARCIPTPTGSHSPAQGEALGGASNHTCCSPQRGETRAQRFGQTHVARHSCATHGFARFVAPRWGLTTY